MDELIEELQTKLKKNRCNNNSKWKIIFSFDVLPKIITYDPSNNFLEEINSFNKNKLVVVKMENKKLQKLLNQEIIHFKQRSLKLISIHQKIMEEIKTFDKSQLQPVNRPNNEGWLNYFISFIY